MSSTVLEDVARIIDPEPWAQVDRWYVHGERVNVDRSIVKPSVDKARTILALIPGRDEAALPEAVAWRVKDFADGWIYYNSADRAHLEAKTMSAGVVQPLYAAPPPPPVGGQAGDVVRLVEALNGLRAEWHRQAEAYEKDSKKSEPATSREMARSYSALLDRVASDLKLTITCATQAYRATHPEAKGGEHG